MKTLYFDCFSGISGDMTVGALLDLGADTAVLETGLKMLNVEGYRLKIEKRLKNGISGTQFEVLLDEEQHQHPHVHIHEHPHVHAHSHSEAHHHGEHQHSHAHRSFHDIEHLIVESGLNDNTKKISLDIFRLIAEAEGKIHGKPANEVHFHEVGAVDSIVDIVGTAICIDQLSPDRIIFSSLPLSRGFVRCQHGTFPLPAPAVLEILRGVPVYYTSLDFELVTPTGAGIAKALAHEFGALGEGCIERIGYGLGKKTYEIPNVLRVMLYESKKKIKDSVLAIEANIDDMTPEQMGYAMEKLFSEGALDVSYTSILMKKNRPGVRLSVLCSPEKKSGIVDAVFKHTSTFGIRYALYEREILERAQTVVETKAGSISCKLGWHDGALLRVSPEYEDCRLAAEKTGKSIMAVYAEAIGQVYKEKQENQ